MTKRTIWRLRAFLSRFSAPSNLANFAQVLEAKQASGRRVLCNLGCGTRIHPDWINIDFLGDGKDVFSWDLRRGLPLPDRSCDAVYTSHAIEHFDRDGAKQFLTECRRVLRPEGIIRVVAPDLEATVRAYLSCLEATRRSEPAAEERYEWIIIELLDQMVRHEGGGEMLKYWGQSVVPAEEFVAQRVGIEYWRARKHCKGRAMEKRTPEAREVGKFRLGGEVHQWMYDKYSLGKLLVACGFGDVHACIAAESSIADFANYHLDTEPDGTVYKPDSFFMEGQKPLPNR